MDSVCDTVNLSFRSPLDRVQTRYVGSGIKGVGSGIRRVGSEITALGLGISDHRIGIGVRDQAVPYMWHQGRKLVTLLESEIRHLRTSMGSAMKKRASLLPYIGEGYREKSLILRLVFLHSTSLTELGL